MKVILLLFFVTSFHDILADDCLLYKTFVNHTMCVYKEKLCPGKTLIRSGGLTTEDKTEIVSLHNSLRNNLVEGTVKGQPKATSMATMVWDDELAKIAQRFADQCQYGQHDKMRDVARFKVGQNIVVHREEQMNVTTNLKLTQAIMKWWNEVFSPGFPVENIYPFKGIPQTGHYSQMAWATTSHIGCGYVVYKAPPKNYTEKLLTCNYGPRGNVLGKAMYVIDNVA